MRVNERNAVESCDEVKGRFRGIERGGEVIQDAVRFIKDVSARINIRQVTGEREQRGDGEIRGGRPAQPPTNAPHPHPRVPPHPWGECEGQEGAREGRKGVHTCISLLVVATQAPRVPHVRRPKQGPSLLAFATLLCVFLLVLLVNFTPLSKFSFGKRV